MFGIFTRFLFSILFLLLALHYRQLDSLPIPAAAFTMIVAYGFGLARPGFVAAFDFAFPIAIAFAFAYFAFAVAFTVAPPVRCVALLKLECSCSGAAAVCALDAVSRVLSFSLSLSHSLSLALSVSVSSLSLSLSVERACVRLLACSLCRRRCCCCCFSCWFTLAPAPLLLPSQLRAAPSEFA